MAKKYPAVVALVAVLAGILTADNAGLSHWIYFLFLIVLFPPAIIFYMKNRPAPAVIIALLCLASFSAFGFCFRYETYPPGHIRHFVDDDRQYTVYGTVDDWPEIRERRTGIFITVDSLTESDKTIKGQGRLLVNIGSEATDIQYGDRISFTSNIYSIKGGKNPSGLNYRRYLNLKGVTAAVWLPHQYSIMVDKAGEKYYMRLVDRLRHEIVKTFRNTLDTNAAALASGFLIGDTRDIPVEIYNLFRDSGTLHLLAVSGSNVALVVLLFVFLLRASRLSPIRRTIFLLVVIVLFSFLSYNQPSVVRASVMAALVLIGQAIQRKREMNNIIASAALIILLVKPTELYDIGFQLSFITAWGLIFLVPKVTVFFKPLHSRLYYKVLIFPFIISVIAQLAALPMTACYFQRMPLISPISNLVIVPLVSMIVIGELIFLFASFILPAFGSFVGAFLNPLLLLTISLLEFFGSGETALIFAHHVSVEQLLAYYTILAAVFVSLSSKTARRFAVIFIMTVINVFMASRLLSPKDCHQMTVFSVPGGIAAVNQVQRNQVVISDLSLKDYSICEQIVTPYLVNRKIDSIDIISLSNDYQTNREIAFLLANHNPWGTYIPAPAKKLLHDIMALSDQMHGSSRITLINPKSIPESLNKEDAILSGRMLIYQYDSLVVVFIGGREDYDWGYMRSLAGERQLVAIKAVIDKNDFLSLERQNFNQYPLIICNKFSATIRKQLSRDSRPAPLNNYIQTSQVGAVELVIENGRLAGVK